LLTESGKKYNFSLGKGRKEINPHRRKKNSLSTLQGEKKEEKEMPAGLFPHMERRRRKEKAYSKSARRKRMEERDKRHVAFSVS